MTMKHKNENRRPVFQVLRETAPRYRDALSGIVFPAAPLALFPSGVFFLLLAFGRKIQKIEKFDEQNDNRRPVFQVLRETAPRSREAPSGIMFPAAPAALFPSGVFFLLLAFGRKIQKSKNFSENFLSYTAHTYDVVFRVLRETASRYRKALSGIVFPAAPLALFPSGVFFRLLAFDRKIEKIKKS